MTYADSYREAFEPADSTTSASIHTLASRLMAEVEIRSRVDLLIKARERAVVDKAVTDREKVTDHLREALAGGETDQLRLRAAELLGKASGLFSTEVNVTTQERDSSQVASEIQEKLAGLLGSKEIDQEEAESDHENVH
jgi:hypothetical protein|tara:strand:- start:556 stop:972 length:417 start_codon:yes stop_codon:yes gene_type:complete